MPQPQTRSIHVRLPVAQAAWLEAEAAVRMVSVSRLVNEAVERLPEHLHGGPQVKVPQ